MPENENPQKEVYVGAVIEINQRRINLIPTTPINQIEERGLKLALDKPLELGKFGEAMNSICKDIGIENPLSKEKVKDTGSPLLQKAAEKVVDAKMRIEVLQYEQPPQKDNKPTKYVFVASVNWDDDNNKAENKDKDKDFFKLKGLIFGVSSGFTNNQTGENAEVQKAFLSALQVMASPSLPASTQDPDVKPAKSNSVVQ